MISTNEAAAIIDAVTKIHHAPGQILEVQDGQKEVLIVDGIMKEYANPYDATPATIQSSTLQSVVDYLLTEIPKTDTMGKVIVHVENPATVEIIAPIATEMRQKFTYLSARAKLPTIPLTNNALVVNLIPVEQMIVLLQSTFEPTPDRESLISFLGQVRIENSLALTDDGVTQTVTRRTGVVRTDTVPITNPWVLKPFRTFTEVEQPASPFILRLSEKDNGSASLTLADGGKWESVAVLTVAAWLRAQINDAYMVVA